MSNAPFVGRLTTFGPLLSAYRLRLARAAEKLGAQSETWGGNVIRAADEERVLAGEDAEFRLAPYPFPGLRSFAPDEGDLFFGRERSVAEVRDLLQAQRVVVVSGGSGSGKSSLVRAGLLPFLNTRHRIRGRNGNWYRAEFRPRTDPVWSLAEALADQVLMPFLALDKPGTAGALGLPADCTGEAARARLRESVHAEFLAARERGRDAVLKTLLDLAHTRLDALDRMATDGLRVSGPSLLLLLDQFEEVFRPEVSVEARETLLDLIVDLHGWMRTRPGEGGLFLTVTMRSEELHRCAEHRGLSDVVTRSLYMLELLDPEDADDAADLHRAMVRPARNVFEDWGLELDEDNPDAPFACGVPAWLLSGVVALSHELEHRPDQLPLLQHALQAMWHAAIRDWSRPDFRGERLEIRKEHLPGQLAGVIAGLPDLGGCLKARVDRAAVRAAERFSKVAGVALVGGNAALQAAFRSLARRDDRGNWARRFAERAEMEAFLATEPSLIGALADRRWAGLREALNVFLLRGYLSGGEGKPYDISHEALIRNWPQFQNWLRDPGEIAYALGRVLTEVEPKEFAKFDDAAKMETIREDMSRRVQLRTEGGELPRRWGADQIALLLLRPAMRARWGGDEAAALVQVAGLAKEADAARERAATAKRAEDVRQVKDEAKRRRERLLFLGGVLLLLTGGGAWTLIDKVESRAAIEVANSRAEAQLARSEAQLAQSRIDAEVAHETARELAAHGLIGAIQSAEVSRWAPGVRERGALQALAMLSGRAGVAPEREMIRRVAYQRLEVGVRSMLGQQLRLQVIAPSTPRPEEQPICLDIGNREGSSESVMLAFEASPTALQVQLVAGGQDGAIVLRDNAGRSIPHDIQIPTILGARVCLARDGSVLTFSAPSSILPVVYELTWLRCSQHVVCRAGGDWQVVGRHIEPPPSLIANLRARRMICVRRIGTIPDAGEGGEVALLNVDFTGEDSPDSCAGSGSGPMFRASYELGVATPRAVKSEVGRAVTLVSCLEVDRHESAPGLGPHRRCSVAVPGSSDPIDVMFWQDPNRPNSNYWFGAIFPLYEAAPLNGVTIIAPTIAQAGFDSHGDLVLAGADGSFYKLIAGRRRVRMALCARIVEQNLEATSDVGMVMTLDERRAPRPDGCP